MAKDWSDLVKAANKGKYLRARPLKDPCGAGNDYNSVLDCDLEQLVRARLRRLPRVRLLDIGAGVGLAMRQLKDSLADVADRVDIVPIDLRGSSNVVQADLHTYEPPSRFDLITSVYCWNYLPDKLEMLEHVNNDLLAARGQARIHFQSTLLSILNKQGSELVPDEHAFDKFIGKHIPTARYIYGARGTEPRVLVFEKRKHVTFPVILKDARIPIAQKNYARGRSTKSLPHTYIQSIYEVIQ